MQHFDGYTALQRGWAPTALDRETGDAGDHAFDIFALERGADTVVVASRSNGEEHIAVGSLFFGFYRDVALETQAI